MKRRLFTIVIVSATVFSNCSIPFGAYLRNLTNETALINGWIIDQRNWPQLPNMVNVAGEVVEFKSGLRKKFRSRELVRWIDTAHFTFELKPQTSADLRDMAGSFMNGSPHKNVRVMVVTKTTADTLINGDNGFYMKKFTLTNYGLSNPTYYYDIK